ncbi:MAG TPA: nicotinate-nucleotide adenylyltransferase [Patescibacteria group bacterium]|nr:nicotinate-nucleotide adenylyltransferase [Patescibacteria group bacterium]
MTTNAVRKIGIMGGTFDPIHIGHLVIAEAVCNEFQLDRVIFIPANIPPHKQGWRVTSTLHRYIMTISATYSNPNFFVSDMEMERPGPSYTIDTMETLAAKYYPGAELYFILGADAVCDLPTWNHVDRLLELCWFVATTRPGCVSSIDAVIEQLGSRGREKILRLNTPELEISSTDIRERIRKGRSIKYIVPESVARYIEKEGLYRN